MFKTVSPSRVLGQGIFEGRAEREAEIRTIRGSAIAEELFSFGSACVKFNFMHLL